MAEWVLLAIALIADLLTIAGFLGVVASRGIRLAIGSSLAVVGVALGVTILVRAVTLWRSPEGVYYSQSYHSRRIASATAALLVAAALTAFVVDLALSKSGSKTKKGTPAPSAATRTAIQRAPAGGEATA
jgi:multisubunit Na+/H+ antiporter MnhC subunit